MASGRKDLYVSGTYDELKELIADLRQYNDLNQRLCDWLDAWLAGMAEKLKPVPGPVPEPAPEPEPPITLEQVRGVLADKSSLGHTTEVRALLQKYGAAKLSQVNPANYRALLADAEALG